MPIREDEVVCLPPTPDDASVFALHFPIKCRDGTPRTQRLDGKVRVLPCLGSRLGIGIGKALKERPEFVVCPESVDGPVSSYGDTRRVVHAGDSSAIGG